MPNPFNITILDTSPIFRYYPSQDGPIDSSWNTSFSGSSDLTWVPQSSGVGTSAHRTTLPGATVHLDWLGTAIYLYGDASVGAYTIQLDGVMVNVETSTPGLLFAKSGLIYQSHSLTLAVVRGTTTTSISSAIITVGMGETGTIINRTIDTVTVPPTRDDIVLTGMWYQFTGLIGTNLIGSTISFPISSASGFYVVGHVNFDHGPFRVTFTPPSDLGPTLTFEYNGSSRWISPQIPKFLATGLNRTRTYRVQITNLANSWYDQNQIVIFDTSPTPSSNPSPSSGSNSKPLSAGAIAGIVIGLLLFLIVILLFFLWWKRRSPQTDGVTTQHDSLNTAPSNPPIMSTALLPPLPNAQEWVPDAEYPTTEFRPFHPDSMISQPEPILPLSAPTSFTNPNISPPYPIPRDLSQEDARFFNNLYALNVPAADIASMMEALRTEREAAANANRMEGSSSGRAIRVEPEVVNTVPPRYDFKG